MVEDATWGREVGCWLKLATTPEEGRSGAKIAQDLASATSPPLSVLIYVFFSIPPATHVWQGSDDLVWTHASAPPLASVPLVPCFNFWEWSPRYCIETTPNIWDGI